MQVFKAALKIVWRHPVYLIVYIVLLSTLGTFLIGAIIDTDDSGEFEASRPSVAIIDRDGGALSLGLAEELARHADIVELADDKQAMQDATAQGLADYIILIKPHFTDEFMTALKAGESVPSLETVISYTSVYGTMMNQVTNQFLSLFSTGFALDPDASVEALVTNTIDAMTSNAQVEIIKMGDSESLSAGFVSFMRFSSYPLTAGIIVCVTMLMAAFNRGEIRRRDLASPLKHSSFSAQTALACLMVALFAWVWISLLAFIVFGSSFKGVPPLNIALIMLVVLVYTTVPLALGYLFAQIGLKENSANAAGNIVAMALSFLGGAWIDLKFLGQEVIALAHFTPAYWYTESITQIAELTTAPSQAVLVSVFGNMGVLLLFSAAILTIAVVVGKMRVQSAEAGGNSAAVRSRA